MAFPLWVETPRGPVEAFCLLDSGAESSFVQQRWAKQHLPDIDSAVRQVRAINNTTVKSYGTRKLHLTVGDAGGEIRDQYETVESVDMLEYDVILGYPWLEHANPDVRWAEHHWYYRPLGDNPAKKLEDNLEVISPQTCAILALNGARVYVLHTRPLIDGDTIGFFGAGMPAEDTIPPEYVEFAHVFSEEEASILAPHQDHDHAIEVEPGTTPPLRPLYPLSPKELGVVREYINTALDKGWIRHSTSPAGAPILFAPKKDGSLRLCVDYRGLNQITIKNRYPLPLVGEIMDRLSGATIYTQLDLRDAYHRLRIRKGDEWKTAFRTRYGHFEYQVMPFGLANAPATFQSYINRALSDLLDTCCIVYLDDILIYSRNAEEHVKHVQMVLERLEKFRLYCKLSKCAFHTDTVNFLGFVISPKGIEMERSRVDTILDWPAPQSVHDILMFLGFANFYRRFIQGYSKIAAPLNDMTKDQETRQGRRKFRKGETYDDPNFTLPLNALHSFENLKAKFASAPLLVHYDPLRQNRIEPDASDFAMAGVYAQLQDDEEWHPVAFWSRKFQGAEARYHTHDKELLAIVESFKHWRHYLEGSTHTITVLSDHANLSYFMTTTELNRRQARWAEKLAAFDFIIQHRPGKKNPADAPSRRPDYEPKEGQSLGADALLPTLQRKFCHSSSAIPQASEEIFENRPKMVAMLARWEPRTTPVCAHNTSCAEECKAADESHTDGDTGIPDILVSRLMVRAAMSTETAYSAAPAESMTDLIRVLQSKDKGTSRILLELTSKGRTALSDSPWSKSEDGLLRFENRVFIPKSSAIIQEILKVNHDDPQGGHLRERRTYQSIRSRYYWHGMGRDVKDYVQRCQQCQNISTHRHKPYGLLEPLPVPARPMDWISMDFITGLPPSKWRGNVYDAVLVIVDMFTKYSWYLPCTKDINADNFATLFYDDFVRNEGMPANIVSDRGSLFTSEFWSILCHNLCVKRRLSTAYHPQTDGQTERQNQTLEHYLRAYTNWHQDDWTRWLALAQLTYNTAEHSALGMAPANAVKAFIPDLHINVDNPMKSAHLDAHERTEDLAVMREFLKERLQGAKDAMKIQYDKKRIPRTFKVGEWIMLRTKNIKTGRPAKKLDDKQIGPFQIVHAVGKQAYTLQLPPAWRHIHPTYHISLLEPWKGTNEPHDRPGPVEDNDEYAVEEVLNDKKVRNRHKYLVKWKGWPKSDATWEPEEHLADSSALDEYMAKKAKRPTTAQKVRRSARHDK